MKIRGKLTIAFIIIIMFPLLMLSLCFHIILKYQQITLKSSYNLSSEVSSLIFNPIKTVYHITLSEYEDLVEVADTTPDKFTDWNYLVKINNQLKKKDSFLIIKKQDSEYFIGDTNAYQKMSFLPTNNDYSNGLNNLIFIDRSFPVVIKEKDFFFTGNCKGQFFLVTDLNILMPQWKNTFYLLIICFMITMIITAFILIFWIYGGIVKPIQILKLASQAIGNGNLDYIIESDSNDEIGELCQEFESMRIRLKKLIQDRLEYEQATRDMMSNISHDLRTPITAIKGYSEGILDGVADTTEKQIKYLKTIYAKANDMTYLVDELSVFAKIEQNSLPYNFVSFSLDEFFQYCLDSITLDLEVQHTEIHYHNYTDPSTNVIADPEQLKRVVNNIIGNCMKYAAHESGKIEITVINVPLPKKDKPLYRQINSDGTDVHPEEKPDEFVQIEIADNGPGISANDLPYIFDQFYRADASRNSSKRGSGLGLAIVKKIIEDHGGSVWATSTENEGTQMFFTLKKSVNKPNN